MGATDFSEQTLLAACVQGDIELIRQLRLLGFAERHFHSQPCSEVYSALSKIENVEDVSSAGIIEEINLDPQIEPGKKVMLRSFVEQLARHSVKSQRHSLDILKRKKRDMELHEALGEAAHSVADKDYERAWEILDRASKLRQTGEDYEYFEYGDVDAWESRVTKRAEIDGSASNNVKFEFMDYLKPYFEFGFPSQSIFCVAGQTGVGKSLFAANVVREASAPHNGLNVLAIVAENRYIEFATRLDSILLNVLPNDLKAGDEKVVGEGRTFFQNMQSQGWGYVGVVKAIPTKFNANTIAMMIDEYTLRNGFKPQVLVLDSPDHMTSVSGGASRAKWEKLAQIYWEVKALADIYDLSIFTTAQLTRGAGKEDKKGQQKRIEAEDIGGSYAISQIVDVMVVYYKSTQDFLLDRRRIEIVKNRDGNLDGEIISLSLKPTLRLEGYTPSDLPVSDGTTEKYTLRRAPGEE